MLELDSLTMKYTLLSRVFLKEHGMIPI